MNNTFAKYRPPYFWTRYRFSLLLQNISLHTFGQDIDSLYFCKISASILLDKISILFTFAKYRPAYFWIRYIITLRSFKMLNIIMDHKMVPPLSALFIMEPLSLPNQIEPCKVEKIVLVPPD